MPNTKPGNVPKRPGAGAQILGDGKSCSSAIPTVEPLIVLENTSLAPQPKRSPRLRCCTLAPNRSRTVKTRARDNSAILGSLASHLSPQSLRLARTVTTGGEAKKRRVNQMAIAREVQRKLLPQHMPVLETLDYAGSCEPAWTVGGDYYDFLDKGNGRVGFVLADVSGKGVSAALLMANLQASVRSQYVPALEDLGDCFVR
jgi:sigma-B regulation protein RsbU (phosphoserine phosphatase)